MDKDFIVNAVEKILKAYNPGLDINSFNWREYVDSNISFEENIKNLKAHFPTVKWGNPEIPINHIEDLEVKTTVDQLKDFLEKYGYVILKKEDYDRLLEAKAFIEVVKNLTVEQLLKLKFAIEWR